MKNPTITIKYNRFLDPIFEAYIRSQKGLENWDKPSMEVVRKNIDMYREEWKGYGERALTAMQEVTGLRFKRNEIDIHIVSGNGRPFSRPIVLKSRYSKMDFINVAIHELIHCLYSDNSDRADMAIVVPHESEIVRNHIVLHAILKYIYLDVFKEPERLRAHIGSNKDSEYAVAWKIVEDGDYKKIISDFKKRLKV